jgi:hypothetical protein
MIVAGGQRGPGGWAILEWLDIDEAETLDHVPREWMEWIAERETTCQR